MHACMRIDIDIFDSLYHVCVYLYAKHVHCYMVTGRDSEVRHTRLRRHGAGSETVPGAPFFRRTDANQLILQLQANYS